MFSKLYNRSVLVDFGSFSIVNYGLYFAIGMCLYLQWLYILSFMLGIVVTWKYAFTVSLSYSVCFIVGTKLLRIFYQRREFLKSPMAVLRKNGNSFYGGVAGFIVAAWIISSIFEEVSFIKQIDMTFLSFPIFQIFIRVACASYGCCFGHEYQGPTSIIYHEQVSPAFQQSGSKPVHATQFYGIIKNLVVFCVMFTVFNRIPSSGLPTVMWLVLYPALRFFVDFSRSWVGRKYRWNLRPSQWISIYLFVFGIALMSYIPLKPYPWTGEFINALLNSIPYFIAPLIAFCFSLVAFGVSFSTKKIEI